MLAQDVDADNLPDWVLEYLNSGGQPPALEEQLNAHQMLLDSVPYQMGAQVQALDLTGDGRAEIVVQARVPAIPYDRGYLLIYGCGPARYQLQYHYFNDQPGNSIAILAITDLTADGLAEIVYYWDSIGTTGSFAQVYYVLGWDGADFVHLVESDQRPDGFCCAAFVPDVLPRQSRLEDINSDGAPELLLRSGVPKDCHAGPVRETWWIWSWNGAAIGFDRLLPDPPQYRFQAVQDGDRLTVEGRLQEALEAYQAAIFDESLERGTLDVWVPRLPQYCFGTIATVAGPDDRPYLEAYSRYRIVLIHLARGDQSAAKVVFDALRDKFPPGQPGSAFTELAQVFWTEFQAGADLAEGCSAASEYARNNQAETLGHLGNDPYYGWANLPPEPEEICPFPLEPKEA